MKFKRHIITKIILLFAIMLLPTFTAQAASIKIRYNKKTTSYKGQQISTTVDGKKINQKKMPGILINDTSMVPYDYVFKKGIGATCTFDSSKGLITISKNEVTVKLTIGSKTAYINDLKTTIPVAPLKVKYYKTKKTKVLVPANFVAVALGYQYSWKNISKTSLKVKIVTPKKPAKRILLHYNDQWNKYMGKKCNASFDGKKIGLGPMPVLIRNNTALVPAELVFSNSLIGANYNYDEDAGTVTLTNGDKEIVFTVGSKVALVNGNNQTMDTEVVLALNEANNTTNVMIPAGFTATNLGFTYEWNSSTRTSTITTPGTDKIYFVWNQIQENQGMNSQWNEDTTAVDTQPTDTNITDNGVMDPLMLDMVTVPTGTITNVTAGYLLNQDKDYITFTGSNVLNPVISSDSTNIYLDFPATLNGIGEQAATISDSNCLKNVSANTQADGSVHVVIGKTNNSSYYLEQEGNQTTLYFVKNMIKIAIDAGHGSYTAGKRTPKMLVDIDFEGDGIIDVYAGQQIKEHVANVGVSKYLSSALKRCGFAVYESAFGDEDISLSNRQKNIKNEKCNYSVSIHFNASGNGTSFNSGQGVSIYKHKTANKAKSSAKFAATVLREMIQGTPQKNRGVLQAGFAMCDTSKMGTEASILVETAFMTNENEAVNMMGSAAFWKETGEEIAKGICKHTGVTYIPE